MCLFKKCSIRIRAIVVVRMSTRRTQLAFRHVTFSPLIFVGPGQRARFDTGQSKRHRLGNHHGRLKGTFVYSEYASRSADDWGAIRSHKTSVQPSFPFLLQELPQHKPQGWIFNNWKLREQKKNANSNKAVRPLVLLSKDPHYK